MPTAVPQLSRPPFPPSPKAMERRGGCEDDAGAWAQSSGPVYELAADMVEREVEGPPGVEPGFAKLIEVELASELDRGEPEGGTVGGRSGACNQSEQSCS